MTPPPCVIDVDTASERTLAAGADDLPLGCLVLADLGFFDLDRLLALQTRGVHFISRLPTRLCVNAGRGVVPIATWLKSLTRKCLREFDGMLTLGVEQKVSLRVVAKRCAAEVARKRLAALEARLKKKGRSVSEEPKEMSRWWVMTTDLSKQQASQEELTALYRARWQVELLFKRMKSLGGLNEWTTRKKENQEVEMYAKMMACLIVCWSTMMVGGALARLNLTRVWNSLRSAARDWAKALLAGVDARDYASLWGVWVV